MKRFSHDELRQLSTDDIIGKIGKYSVLKSVGADYMRLKMVPVGFACRLILWIILQKPRYGYFVIYGVCYLLYFLVFAITYMFCPIASLEQQYRHRMDNVLNFFFPTEASPNYYKDRALEVIDFFFPTVIAQNDYEPPVKELRARTAVAYAFNHQSLFEVLATLRCCLADFADKEYSFPVNQPWYECLKPMDRRLTLIGLNIKPIFTPATERKLRKHRDKVVARAREYRDNPKFLVRFAMRVGIDFGRRYECRAQRALDNFEIAEVVKTRFDRQFSGSAGDDAMQAGVVPYAPTATRTPAMYYSKADYDCDKDEFCCESDADGNGVRAPRVTSAILLGVRRAAKKYNHEPLVDFVPVTVVPSDCNRKGRVYRRPATKGLNIFRLHYVYIGVAINFEQMSELQKERRADHTVFKELTRHLPKNLWYLHE